MAKRKRQTEPAEPPAHPIGPASRPDRPPFGVEHLRRVMDLSRDADVERIAEDAACEIERLRTLVPPRPWRDTT